MPKRGGDFKDVVLVASLLFVMMRQMANMVAGLLTSGKEAEESSSPVLRRDQAKNFMMWRNKIS